MAKTSQPAYLRRAMPYAAALMAMVVAGCASGGSGGRSSSYSAGYQAALNNESEEQISLHLGGTIDDACSFDYHKIAESTGTKYDMSEFMRGCTDGINHIIKTDGY